MLIPTAQVRALSKLSGVFMAGTTAQLVALAIVIYKLLSAPDPAAATQLVARGEHWTNQVVGVLNMVFSFGGQVGRGTLWGHLWGL